MVWNGTEDGTDVVAGRNAGDGINVSILDTGIDYNHSDLADNYKVFGYDFVNGDTDPTDDNGHGTHCAGIIAAVDNDIGVIGVAPEADLYAVKVLDSSGSGYVSDVIAGIEWSVNNSMDIISMSLGLDSDSTDLRNACDYAYNAGLLLVAAAGNEGSGSDTVTYPAKYDSVIAVAATDSSDNRTSSSSTGPAVELAAPGKEINSTWSDGGYKKASGTSMACPHVTGTAALVWKAFPHYNNTQVRQHLQETAEDLGDSGMDKWYGYGLVDAENASDTTPPVSVTNLNGTAVGETWINWTWTNPTDKDFSHVTVYLNGTWKVNTPNPFYNATGLNASTNYELGTHTVDNVGNINETWVNNTATTLPDTTPPASITNLANARGIFWINWTWTNPTDIDFNYTLVYLNGSWNANTSDPFYNVTGLNADTDYEIETHTVDTSGNINETWVNQTATTLSYPPNITSYYPSSPVNDTESATRTFNITVDQTVNVSWQINGTEVQTNESVTEASYTNTSAIVGYWNVSVIVSNSNGTAIQTWMWTVNDTTPPVISIIAISSITTSSAMITWNTDELSDSSVEYGTTSGNYPLSASNTTYDKSHSIVLSGLASSTTYYYVINSTDRSENSNQTAEYSFTTTTPSSPPPSGGGGGGGGGGGYVAPTQTPTPTPTPTPAPSVTKDLSDKIDEAGTIKENIKIISADENSILDIPPGTKALDLDKKPLGSITITPTDPSSPPVGTQIIGLTYDLEPDGAIFNPPINLTIHYNQSLLPEDVNESELKIAYYDGVTKAWKYLKGPFIVDVESNTILAPLSHFSVFAVIAVISTPTPATPTPTWTPVPTPVPTPTPTSTPTPRAIPIPPPEKQPWALIIGIIVAVVVVGTAAYYIYTKKKT